MPIKTTKEFTLYEFNELGNDSQDRAISDRIEFEIEVMDDNSPYTHCADEMEKMRTPWFLGNCIYGHHKQDIIDTIKCNTYLFFKNGELIPLDMYPKNWNK